MCIFDLKATWIKMRACENTTIPHRHLISFFYFFYGTCLPMLPLGCLCWKMKKTSKHSKAYCTTEGCLEHMQVWMENIMNGLWFTVKSYLCGMNLAYDFWESNARNAKKKYVSFRVLSQGAQQKRVILKEYVHWMQTELSSIPHFSNILYETLWR